MFYLLFAIRYFRASLVAQSLQCRRPGFNPCVGMSPGEGNGKPLQYSCLENSMDRWAWWATLHGGRKELDTTKSLTHTVSYVIPGNLEEVGES